MLKLALRSREGFHASGGEGDKTALWTFPSDRVGVKERADIERQGHLNAGKKKRD